MSFIKSDSLLSNIKNISIRIDMRPNDGSNIFKSIFSNIQQREKSIKFQSLFDIDCEIKQGNSLIDKLTGSGSQQPVNENKEKERLHYNWIVCKNGGMSENEESENNGSEDDEQQQQKEDNHNINLHQLQHQHQHQNTQKDHRQQPHINNNHHNSPTKRQKQQSSKNSPVKIGQHNKGFIYPPSSIIDNNNNNHHNNLNSNNHLLQQQHNNQLLYNPNHSVSQMSLLQFNSNNNSNYQNNSCSQQIQQHNIGAGYHHNNKYLQNSLSLSSFNYLQDNNTSSQPTIQKKVKNQTKNIPKNYGKAIICYIEKYRHKVQLITDHFQIDYFALLQDLKKKKKSINTIADLRNLWSKYKYAKCMRVITYEFLRKHALSYIFDSRICTYGSHIKYRQRLCEAVASPEEFKHIKDY